MELETILLNLKKKVYHPIYLLHGEEPYFIDLVSDYIEKNVLTEDEKSFNQTIFYGIDSDAKEIALSAWRFPMMAQRQVIIVKEAQSLKNILELEPYALKPMASTILVLNYKYKNLDGRSKLYKAIKSNGVVLTTKKIYENQLPSWIEKHLKQYNYTIDPQASQILAASLGTELSKVANELDKLVIAVKDTTHIKPVHVEKNIGLNKDFNLFELQDALGSRNIFKANQIINYFGNNEKLHPIQLTIQILYSYYSKILAYHFIEDKSEKGAIKIMNAHPYVVQKIIAASKKYNATKLYEIIGILREYDLKSKGLGASGMVNSAELQKEMIFKILH